MLENLRTRWAGRGEVRYEKEMTSTNRVLRDMAQSGAPHGSLAVCDHQTAGRGRLQRSWDTPPGLALTHSLLLRPNLSAEQMPLVTLAAAVAAARAVESVCTQLTPGIKWPNDVVLGGRKCAGILCEAGMDGGAPYVIAGVGINVNQTSFPGELGRTATSILMETGTETDRWALLEAYLLYMEEAVETLEREGLAGLLPTYEKRSVTIGRRVRVISPAETYTAMADGMDEEGALLVTDDAGRKRRVLCGDVSVRGLMGYCDEEESKR